MMEEEALVMLKRNKELVEQLTAHWLSQLTATWESELPLTDLMDAADDCFAGWMCTLADGLEALLEQIGLLRLMLMSLEQA